MKKVKVVITLLGERKIKSDSFIPVCGRSVLVDEKIADLYIKNKYAKKCEIAKVKKSTK